MKKLCVIGLLAIQQLSFGSEFLGAITTSAKKAANYVKDYYVDPMGCLENPETDEIIADWIRMQKNPSSDTFSPTDAQHLRDRFTKRITIAQAQLDEAFKIRDTNVINWIHQKFGEFLPQPYVVKIKHYLEKVNLSGNDKDLSGSGTISEELLSDSSKTLLDQLHTTTQTLTGAMVQESDFETLERQVSERIFQAESQITLCIKTGNTDRITKILEMYGPHMRPLSALKARVYLDMQKTAINKVLEPQEVGHPVQDVPADRSSAQAPTQSSSSHSIQDQPKSTKKSKEAK